MSDNGFHDTGYTRGSATESDPEISDAIRASLVHGYRRHRSVSRLNAALTAEVMSCATFLEDLDRLTQAGPLRLGLLGCTMGFRAPSWASLVSTILHQSGISIANYTAPHQTTAETIAALGDLLRTRPTHILVMVGREDARRFGRRVGVMQTTRGETHRNLSQLLHLARLEGAAGATLIAPPPARPRTARGADSFWTTEDLRHLHGMIRGIDPSAICLASDLSACPEYWLADGVHPSSRGHVDMARNIVTQFGATLADPPIAQ